MALAGAVLGAAGRLGTGAVLAAVALFAAWLLLVVRVSAAGRDDLPGPSDLPARDALVAPAAGGLVLALASAPPVVWVVSQAAVPGTAAVRLLASPGTLDPLAYLLILPGFFWAPLALGLGAGRASPKAAVHPGEWFRGVRRTGVGYLGLASAFWALVAAAVVVGRVLGALEAFLPVPLLPAVVGGIAWTYLPLVGARLLGFSVPATQPVARRAAMPPPRAMPDRSPGPPRTQAPPPVPSPAVPPEAPEVVQLPENTGESSLSAVEAEPSVSEVPVAIEFSESASTPDPAASPTAGFAAPAPLWAPHVPPVMVPVQAPVRADGELKITLRPATPGAHPGEPAETLAFSPASADAAGAAGPRDAEHADATPSVDAIWGQPEGTWSAPESPVPAIAPAPSPVPAPATAPMAPPSDSLWDAPVRPAPVSNPAGASARDSPPWGTAMPVAWEPPPTVAFPAAASPVPAASWDAAQAGVPPTALQPAWPSVPPGPVPAAFLDAPTADDFSPWDDPPPRRTPPGGPAMPPPAFAAWGQPAPAAPVRPTFSPRVGTPAVSFDSEASPWGNPPPAAPSVPSIPPPDHPDPEAAFSRAATIVDEPIDVAALPVISLTTIPPVDIKPMTLVPAPPGPGIAGLPAAPAGLDRPEKSELTAALGPATSPALDDAGVLAAARAERWELVASSYRARKGAVKCLDAAQLVETGQAALRLEDVPTAAHAFRRAGLDHPDEPTAPAALLYAAQLLIDRLRQPSEGLRLCRTVVERYPSSPVAEKAARILERKGGR